jgi:hypothetical protein
MRKVCKTFHELLTPDSINLPQHCIVIQTEAFLKHRLFRKDLLETTLFSFDKPARATHPQIILKIMTGLLDLSFYVEGTTKEQVIHTLFPINFPNTYVRFFLNEYYKDKRRRHKKQCLL